MPAGADAAAARQRPWVVPAAEACRRLAAGALLLDARDPELQVEDPLPGAVPAAWWRFTEPDPPFQGRLLRDDAELARRWRELGVGAATEAVAVADPWRGWGEDGRIVWTLRHLGHAWASMVDGGVTALRSAGFTTTAPPRPSGDFVVRRRPELAATREWLKAELGRPGLALLDARTAEEHAGATPHGEARGGHPPGARHLHYRDLLAPGGALLPPERLRARLAEAGIGPGAGEPVVAFCTGGTRSAWLTAVLRDLGLPARNFAGSMWDWAAGDSADYPLVTGA